MDLDEICTAEMYLVATPHCIHQYLGIDGVIAMRKTVTSVRLLKVSIVEILWIIYWTNRVQIFTMQFLDI